MVISLMKNGVSRGGADREGGAGITSAVCLSVTGFPVSCQREHQWLFHCNKPEDAFNDKKNPFCDGRCLAQTTRTVLVVDSHRLFERYAPLFAGTGVEDGQSANSQQEGRLTMTMHFRVAFFRLSHFFLHRNSGFKVLVMTRSSTLEPAASPPPISGS